MGGGIKVTGAWKCQNTKMGGDGGTEVGSHERTGIGGDKVQGRKGVEVQEWEVMEG